jgi:hypothetical protein
MRGKDALSKDSERDSITITGTKNENPIISFDEAFSHHLHHVFFL